MSNNSDSETTTLFRPIGLKEFELIRDTGMKAFPPRLDHQPIFYPVLNREYAAQIAKKWNTKSEVSDHVGIVTQFEVDTDYVSQFDRKVVGSSVHEELWVPAEELDQFNEHIVGCVEVIDVFYGDDYSGEEIPESG